MATSPNLSYQTFIKDPQKLGKSLNVVNRKASIIQRAVKKLAHVVIDSEDANVSDILEKIIDTSL